MRWLSAKAAAVERVNVDDDDDVDNDVKHFLNILLEFQILVLFKI